MAAPELHVRVHAPYATFAIITKKMASIGAVLSVAPLMSLTIILEDGEQQGEKQGDSETLSIVGNMHVIIYGWWAVEIAKRMFPAEYIIKFKTEAGNKNKWTHSKAIIHANLYLIPCVERCDSVCYLFKLTNKDMAVQD